MGILVTGSDGFVGSRLVGHLEREGYESLTLDIKTGVDLRDWEQVEDIGPFRVMIHLASLIGGTKSVLEPRCFFHWNLTCTFHALELCRIHRAKMIYVSSYVYGRPDYLPTDEAHPPRALDPYGESKIIGERLCEYYRRRFEIPIIILRPFNLYGPGQQENFIIPTVVRQLNGDGDNIVVDDLAPKRDFLHVDDFIGLLTLLIEYDPTGTEIFNAGSGTSASVKEIIEMLCLLSGRAPKIFSRERRRTDGIPETRADISKAGRLLGWEPGIVLKEGLRRLLIETI
jgi:nucleoside-diphosphate-sugar epimerase